MASEPKFYALLVGIDRYKSASVPDLRGCVTDVRAMYTFLTTRLALPHESVRLLTASQEGGETPEQLASYRNIVSAWQALVDKVGEGDQLFFHYSGHGAQARSIDPHEPDGYDETLVPYDSRDVGEDGNPVYDILDKELAALIDQAESKGAYVTVFLDCCHSGSGTRAAEQPDPSKPLTRRGPSDKRVRPPETLVPGTLTRLTQITEVPQHAGRSGWQIRTDSQHVLLAGCRDEELSHEYRAPETGDWHGATTYFLIKALRNYRPEMTWREVHNFVQTRVNAVYERQLPQLEGPGNRQVFGGMAAPETPHLLVTEVEADGNQVYVKVNGGAAVGLSEGSRIALYAEGNAAMSGEPLATGIVEQTKVDHAWARLEASLRVEDVPVPARVKITAMGYDTLIYPVAVDDELVKGALTGGEGELSPFLKIVPDDDPGAQFRVAMQGDHYVIQDGSGTQIVTQSQPRTEAGAKQIAEDLEHLAIYNNVRNLRNPAPMPMLQDAITVQAVSYTQAGFNGPRDGIALDDTDSVLTPGRKIWLTIRNNTSENLYISVFNLSANYGIFRLYPQRAPYQLVAGGKEFFVDGLEPEINNPFAAKSREIFKIFATADPMSFDVLELPELNEPLPRGASTRATGPLADLLNGIRSEGTRKIVIRRDDTHERWITAQIELTVLSDNEVRALEEGPTTVDLGSPLDISLQKPADFTGELIFSSVTQLTRGTDIEEPIKLPPGLVNPEAQTLFQPLAFSGSTRSTESSPGVLALNTSPQQLESISEENPLHLEVTVEDEPDLAGILPVAYDGEFFYLAGQQSDPQTRSVGGPGLRRMATSITQLPLPIDTAESSRGTRTAGDVPTRDLKRTVRLFLYKVYKGELPADTGVRKAARAGDGKPIYSSISREEVGNARRVALLVHGFTSDTGWFVQQALPHLEAIGGYDLFLAYDYETYNTAIEENGARLAAALEQLGFSQDDGIHLDIFSHSMGTQVARVLVELKGGDAYVDRVFMGGPPNAGTRLAEAKKFIFWLGTAALNSAGTTPPALIANWFLKKAVDTAVSIDDLMPRSELYRALNDATAPIDVPYYVQIGTNSQIDDSFNWNALFTKAGLMKLFDVGLDQLLGGPNDLAIGVSSARDVRHGNWPRLAVAELPGNHFEYFYTEKSVEALRTWLAADTG